MTTVNANVTRGKTFVPDAQGIYPVTIDGLHQLGVPTVSVNLSGQIVNADIDAAAAIDPLKLADMAADGIQVKRTARATYDFSVHGGVSGDIELGITAAAAAVVTIPNNAIVTRAWWDVTDPLTSGGSAQVAFKVEGAADLQTAAVLGTHGTAGLHEGIPVDSAATMVKLTAARNLVMTISVADLTAGILTLFVEYVVSL